LDGFGAPRLGRGATDRHVSQGAVGDLEHACRLGERLGVGIEVEEVVDPLALLVDLLRELASAPRLLPDPRPAALLDELAHARDDLVLALFGQLGVEDEHDLVCVHGSRFLLPMV
jgi:hypothetical protein